MNFKTTLVLGVLAAAGGVFWLIDPFHKPVTVSSETLRILNDELKPANLRRVEVSHAGEVVVFVRGPDREWSLPGHWPTRKAEVDKLVEVLTGLQTRFAPVELGTASDLKKYGLDDPAVTVKVQAGDTDRRLQFGEEPGDANRFSRPTFLRIDDLPEVIRLAPGLVGALDRPQEF